MTVVITIWFVLTCLLGLSALIAIWARRPSRARGLSILAFIAASPIAAAALGAALGWPVPLINGVNAPEGTYSVLGSKIIVGKGIYVLIDVGGEPRYYWLPWSQKESKELQEGLNKAGKDGGVQMTIPPFEWSWDQHQTFQPLPQQKVIPDKPKPQVQHYERSI
jgi:hypothetical protein